MEITEIKSKLTLSQVLHYYHLKPDKNLRLICPFHDDKTPSMQVYYKTHTAYCFSTNCKTNGKSLDVIDFIMFKESCTKHEAIVKAKSMITGESKYDKPIEELTRSAVLTKMFTYFKNGITNSKPAKAYLDQRCLDYHQIEVGYNSGQFHHGTRKDEALIKSCIKYGLLLDLGNKARTGNPAYKSFGKSGIVFPLKDCHGQIISLYFRSIYDQKSNGDTNAASRHFYLRDRQGLYPGYPKLNTKRLIITESIIDASSLLEQDDIKNNYEVLSMYGTNGLNTEHIKAIKKLKELSEIVFFLDGDDAGRIAVAKYAPVLKNEIPSLKITNVATPQNEDVNSLLQGHSPDMLIHLIDTRKEYDVLFSNDSSSENKTPQPKADSRKLKTDESQPIADSYLDTSNPYNIKYNTSTVAYQIKGFKVSQLDSLKVTLNMEIR